MSILLRGRERTAISDGTGDNGRDDYRDDEIWPGHTHEIATKAGQCRAKNEWNGGRNDVFHKLAVETDLTPRVLQRRT